MAENAAVVEEHGGEHHLCPEVIEARTILVLVQDRLDKGDKRFEDMSQDIKKLLVIGNNTQDLLTAWDNVQGFGKTIVYIQTGLKWLLIIGTLAGIIIAAATWIAHKLGLDKYIP